MSLARWRRPGRACATRDTSRSSCPPTRCLGAAGIAGTNVQTGAIAITAVHSTETDVDEEARREPHVGARHGALVHYHIDIPVNMLWHMRGRKRVWVYPHFDDRFVSQDAVEQVCSGELSEDVPYDPEFDKYALVFDVEPGQLLTWPQLTAHRVTNIEGLNVSLSTEHKNAAATRRINVHLANQFLRRTLGWNCESMEVRGFGAHAKQAVARAARLWNKLKRKQEEQFTYPVTFRVAPDAPLAYSDIEVGFDGIVAPHEELASV